MLHAACSLFTPTGKEQVILAIDYGAEFVSPPIDRDAEIRCYMRDPDGYLIEVGQATGVLHGQLAAKRPEDLPGE